MNIFEIIEAAKQRQYAPVPTGHNVLWATIKEEPNDGMAFAFLDFHAQLEALLVRPLEIISGGGKKYPIVYFDLGNPTPAELSNLRTLFKEPANQRYFLKKFKIAKPNVTISQAPQKNLEEIVEAAKLGQYISAPDGRHLLSATIEGSPNHVTAHAFVGFRAEMRDALLKRIEIVGGGGNNCLTIYFDLGRMTADVLEKFRSFVEDSDNKKYFLERYNISRLSIIKSPKHEKTPKTPVKPPAIDAAYLADLPEP